MAGVEAFHWMEYTSYAQWTADKDTKSLLGRIARAEEVHHHMLVSLLPVPHHPIEGILAGEVALLSAYESCIEKEPNDTVCDAYKHIFWDHLEHANYAARQVNAAGCPADAYTGGADLSDGRSLDEQFMNVEDTMWQGSFTGCYDKNDVNPLTLINVDMALSGEYHAWYAYMCAFNHVDDMDMRNHLAAFSSIEGQHVGILGSLKDPSETMLERSLVHENVEIINYDRLRRAESNDRVRQVFDELYMEDLEHARLFGEMAG
jgi:rubrerythrin